MAKVLLLITACSPDLTWSSHPVPGAEPTETTDTSQVLETQPLDTGSVASSPIQSTVACGDWPEPVHEGHGEAAWYRHRPPDGPTGFLAHLELLLVCEPDGSVRAWSMVNGAAAEHPFTGVIESQGYRTCYSDFWGDVTLTAEVEYDELSGLCPSLLHVHAERHNYADQLGESEVAHIDYRRITPTWPTDSGPPTGELNGCWAWMKTGSGGGGGPGLLAVEPDGTAHGFATQFSDGGYQRVRTEDGWQWRRYAFGTPDVLWPSTEQLREGDIQTCEFTYWWGSEDYIHWYVHGSSTLPADGLPTFTARYPMWSRDGGITYAALRFGE